MGQPYGQPAAPVVPGTGGKSKTGLIIGIIIGVLVLVGGIVALVLVLNNQKSDEKTADNNQSSQTENKETPKQETPKSIKIDYDGKSFSISKNYGDTMKSVAAAGFDLYNIDDDFKQAKVTDLDNFLETNRETTTTTSVNLYIFDADGEDDIITFSAIVPYEKSGELVPYKDFELYNVNIDAPYEETITFSINGAEFTTDSTTKDDLVKLYGESKDITTLTKGEALGYAIAGFEVTFFMKEDESSVLKLNFVTLDPKF